MSRGTVLMISDKLVTEQCCNCGVTFAIPQQLMNELSETHKDFYCPNGHSQRYIDKTEAQKQRERADRLQRLVDAREEDIRFEQRRLDTERKAHAATKGQLTKTRKRVGNGVCPCCNRSFANLQRHMSGQHPDYAETDATD